jgi:hypothetical protein
LAEDEHMRHVRAGPARRPSFTTGSVSAQSHARVSIRFRLCNYRIALKTSDDSERPPSPSIVSRKGVSRWI